MAANDIYLATIRSNVLGQKIANVFHAHQVSADGPDDPADALGQAIATAIVPAWRAATTTDALITSIACRRIYPTQGGEFITPVNLAGTQQAPTYPPNACAIISLLTDSIQKYGRGRTHVSGLPMAEVDDGILSTAQRVLLDYIGDYIATQLPAAGGNSAYDLCLWYEPTNLFIDITSSQVRNRAHTLRSRRLENP